MRLLFICNVNINRSKTAEELFKEKYETQSAGLHELAINPVTGELLQWADIVFVMEDWMRADIGKRFPKQYLQKRILVLDIPDIFTYRQTELITLLRKRVPALIKQVLH
jgi:predicted protein tyrosine phosphatase